MQIHGDTIGKCYHKLFQEKKSESPIEDYSIDELITKIAVLAGKKNLSLTFCESDEFYDLLVYAMALGASRFDLDQGNLVQQIKRLFPQHRRKFYHDALKTTAKTIHQLTMKEFAKHQFVCCAIDQGSVSGRKTVDFVLENPFGKMESYPYYTMPISDQTAEGYMPILHQGLANMQKYDVNLGSVVADGNKAQKKCFDKSWRSSLRNIAENRFIREVIFIPCLCHRVDNALKYHAKERSQHKN